jgi:hypothetical protein
VVALVLFFGMPLDFKFQGYIIIDYIVVILRYIYIGLFISVLYKSLSHR